jgi:hypothetical protein
LQISLSNIKIKFLVVAFVIAAARCIWLWQPERQIFLHQRHLLDAAENHKWSKIAGFLDSNFRDRFGHDKAWALRESQEVLRQFFALTIHDRDTTLEMSRDTAKVKTYLRLEGTGTPIAEAAQEAVNSAQDQPFEFSWRHASWLPWDWKLTSVDHPLIERADELHSMSQ